LKKFLISSTAVTAGLALACILLPQAGVIARPPSFTGEILIFVGVTTVILFRYVYRAPSESFVPFYLLTMAVKLLGYGGFAVLIILLDQKNAAPNVILFLVAYGLLTLLEVVFLYRKTQS
jgi:hypothetical protein